MVLQGDQRSAVFPHSQGGGRRFESGRSYQQIQTPHRGVLFCWHLDRMRTGGSTTAVRWKRTAGCGEGHGCPKGRADCRAARIRVALTRANPVGATKYPGQPIARLAFLLDWGRQSRIGQESFRVPLFRMHEGAELPSSPGACRFDPLVHAFSPCEASDKAEILKEASEWLKEAEGIR